MYQDLQRRGELESMTVAGSNKLLQWLQVKQDLWYTLWQAKTFLSLDFILFLHFSQLSSFLKTISWASSIFLCRTINKWWIHFIPQIYCTFINKNHWGSCKLTLCDASRILFLVYLMFDQNFLLFLRNFMATADSLKKKL